MYPNLREGDLIELSPANPVKEGELVIFREQGRLLCHRIQKINLGSVETTGDFTCQPDTPILLENILGKVKSIRRGRRMIHPDIRSSSPPIDFRETGKEAAAKVFRILEDAARSGVSNLKRHSFSKKLLSSILISRTKFFLAHPIPLQSVEGYEEWEIESGNLSGCIEQLPAPSVLKASLLIAKLGKLWLASIDLRTYHLKIRRLFSGLGIEEKLETMAHELEKNLVNRP